MNLLQENIYDAIAQMNRKNEELILEQLGDLVKKDLLVMELSEPSITVDYDNNMRLSRKVKFYLKDKEYIEKLETENQELKKRLEHLSAILRPYL